MESANSHEALLVAVCNRISNGNALSQTMRTRITAQNSAKAESMSHVHSPIGAMLSEPPYKHDHAAVLAMIQASVLTAPEEPTEPPAPAERFRASSRLLVTETVERISGDQAGLHERDPSCRVEASAR